MRSKTGSFLAQSLTFLGCDRGKGVQGERNGKNDMGKGVLTFLLSDILFE